MIDETRWKPGDLEYDILRKILAVLLAGGGSGGGSSGNVVVTSGSLTSAGAVTIADGADVAEGARADAAVLTPGSSASVIALSKGILTKSNTIDARITSLAVDVNGINATTGTTADAAVTNPALNASVIAALKGILTDLTTINTSTVANNNVGGFTVSLKDTTAVSITPAYTAGDAVGAKRTITGALRTVNGSGILESITILDRANQKSAFEIFIFDSNPAAATITDNVAFVFSTDDLKVLAHVTVAATDYITVNSKAVATLKGLGVTLKGADASTSLYAAVVAVGTPTFAATTDLQLIYGILQD